MQGFYIFQPAESWGPVVSRAESPCRQRQSLISLQSRGLIQHQVRDLFTLDSMLFFFPESPILQDRPYQSAKLQGDRDLAPAWGPTQNVQLRFSSLLSFSLGHWPGLRYALKLPNHSSGFPELPRTPPPAVWLLTSRWLTSGCFISSNLDFFFFSPPLSSLPGSQEIHSLTTLGFSF